jgi:OFA family oxalate/formate antiporter-like MFS transporter
MLYTAKGTAALVVPLASVVAARYGWSAVFTIAMGLNITAALLALFVLRPIRARFIAGTADRAAALPGVTGAVQA